MSAPFPGQERAKHMGELKRGDEHWDVYIEMQPDVDVGGGAVRGRVHFVSGERRRTTSWIFLRSEEHTSELQSLAYLVCRLLLEKKKTHMRAPISARHTS